MTVMPPPYIPSRFGYQRRVSRAVRCGEVQIGGLLAGQPAPVVIQTMCTTKTPDIAATVAQCIVLAEAGSEIIRITAPGVKDAQALKDIRRQFSAAGFGRIPLCADIHFMPAAAMEAIEHVEKVRVNPGNFADKKAFKIVEYSDAQYAEEVAHVHERFAPLARRAKALGRCLRIGTNHGSLSDRIMNRWGDSPRGMVESAMEFVRIAESEGLRDLVISMKSSNPKVMVEAYRLLTAHLLAHGEAYPLHLGVTEAGDGEDGRIKSAAGIGALLEDGLGDTVRVSLTEPPEFELPVARALVARYAGWRSTPAPTPTPAPLSVATAAPNDPTDPYTFKRRAAEITRIGADIPVGGTLIPRVLVPLGAPAASGREPTADAVVADGTLWQLMANSIPGAEHGCGPQSPIAVGEQVTVVVTRADRPLPPLKPGTLVLLRLDGSDPTAVLRATVAAMPSGVVIGLAECGLLGETRAYRLLTAVCEERFAAGGERHAIALALPFQHDELAIAAIVGGLLIDGLGDCLYLPAAADPRRLAFTLLQSVKARVTRADYVACPSCGRTQFDLMDVTAHIKEVTNHLDGVTIAIMGCIVNGPGEMADADFGYVGSGPGKIDLYRRKEKVRNGIPQAGARDELVRLIKEHGMWKEPGA
jgi:(E)-4-hydroxy-3-methylbut-2-enyl-diphosphate synthase